MNSHKLKSESGTVKQPDYIKKQQQLKAMNKPFVPNKSINADAMIENLLSNKDTFQKKKDNTVNTPLPPSWLSPDSSTVSPFYSQLWSLVRMSTGQLADTAAVSSLLMTSGLSTDTLGFIWSLANKTVPGSLTQAELYVVLALVTLAQGGYIFNDTTILNQIPQPPIPKLDLTILPQYNMNFAAHSGGISPHYLQSNPTAKDSTTKHPGGVSAHYLQPNPAAKDSTPTVDNQKQPPPVSIMSLDVNKLQGAPVLTLPNYSFGPFQGFDAAGAEITNTAHAQSVSTYQEPSVSAIPSISLGLSTPTKVNHSFQQSTDISVLDRDLTPETNSEVIAFNNINKFKLDSPTKLPSLSQPVVDVAKNLSNLSLKSREKAKQSGAVVENKVGNIDDSFDSLSTERATVNPPKPAGPNYNLDLFELSDEVQHVFPASESSLKKASSNEPAAAEKHDDGDFDDEFTDFQSADFTSFNAATVKHVQKPLPVDDLLSSTSTIIQPESDLMTSLGVLEPNFSTITQPESSLASRIVPESVLESNLFSEPELGSTLRFESGLKNLSTGIDTELNNLSNLDLNFISEPELKSTLELEPGLKNLSIGNPESNLSSRVDPGLSLITREENLITQGFSKNVVDKRDEDDDFSGFQAAPLVISDDELFPKTVTINAPNGTRIVDNSFYEKSETNVSEWSDNTSNDWTAGSGGNRSDTERDADSLNYVDLSDIKLDIPSSDNEEVVAVKTEVKGSDKEDKYSALRGLQPEDVVATDEFGDFLAADPGTEEPYRMREMEVNNSAVQMRCLEACLQILQESYSILSSASSPQVLSEVMSDPRTTNHLTCLLEVFRVSERLIKHVENNDLVNQIQSTWNDILPLLEGSKCYQLEDTTGPVCELCRCDYGPFPMKYGRSTFHAPCVNLYLHYVDSNLPNSEAY